MTRALRPHRRRLDAVELGAAVDLVRHDPRAHPIGRGGHRIEVGGGEAGAGRVVGSVDDDGARLRRDQIGQAIEVGPPEAARAHHRPLAHDAAEGLHEPGDLHVGRHHDDHLVARFDHPPGDDEVRFRPAVRHEDVVGRRAGMERGNRGAELRRAVGLRIESGASAGRRGRTLAEQARTQRRRRFREVVADAVFPSDWTRSSERRDSHGRQYTDGHSSMREELLPRFVEIPPARS
jgi:hypothetical protein